MCRRASCRCRTAFCSGRTIDAALLETRPRTLASSPSTHGKLAMSKYVAGSIIVKNWSAGAPSSAMSMSAEAQRRSSPCTPSNAFSSLLDRGVERARRADLERPAGLALDHLVDRARHRHVARADGEDHRQHDHDQRQRVGRAAALLHEVHHRDRADAARQTAGSARRARGPAGRARSARASPRRTARTAWAGCARAVARRQHEDEQHAEADEDAADAPGGPPSRRARCLRASRRPG